MKTLQNLVCQKIQKNLFNIPIIQNFILFAFLKNTFGSTDPYDEALKFTNDVQSLVVNLKSLYQNINKGSIKNKVTRLMRNLDVENAELAILLSIPTSAEISDEESI